MKQITVMLRLIQNDREASAETWDWAVLLDKDPVEIVEVQVTDEGDYTISCDVCGTTYGPDLGEWSIGDAWACWKCGTEH